VINAINKINSLTALVEQVTNANWETGTSTTFLE